MGISEESGFSKSVTSKKCAPDIVLGVRGGAKPRKRVPWLEWDRCIGRVISPRAEVEFEAEL